MIIKRVKTIEYVNQIRGRLQVFFLLAGFILVSIPLHAQADHPFKSGERLDYTINYKYGIVMVKAGTARYEVKDSKYNGQSAIQTSLSFRTTSAFDKIYKVRDTLYSYSNPQLEPVFHKKHLHESKTSYIEEISYKQYSPSQTRVSSKRVANQTVRFDTLLTASGLGYDMLNVFIFARTLDYATLDVGKSFSIYSFVGRDVVPMKIRYLGQAILDKGDTKYKTHRFEIDITDSAFEESKNAMEIWISDDKNRVPLKLRAKLKIGAAEAELSSSKNLKYPFDSKVVIKK